MNFHLIRHQYLDFYGFYSGGFDYFNLFDPIHAFLLSFFFVVESLSLSTFDSCLLLSPTDFSILIAMKCSASGIKF